MPFRFRNNGHSAPMKEGSHGSGTENFEQLTSFGLKGGEVEVFPEKPGYGLEEMAVSDTLAARDSLALQEVGSVVSEGVHGDVFEDDREDDAISTMSRGKKTRRRLRIAFLLAVVLAVVLAAVLTRSNRKDGRDAEPSIVAGAEEENHTAPTGVPSPAPSSSLELSMEFQVLKPYIREPSKLLDPETPQGKAFEQIMSEGITEDFGFRIKQRFAMMVVYYTMGGENWSWRSGWNDFSEDECDWHGVAICRYRDGRRIAAGLQLPSNNAVGGVPEEICLLQDLETILLENNQLRGELPACLTNLQSAFEVDVHNNAFTGRPPPGFFYMPRLETLDLSSNDFTGGLDFLQGPTSRTSSVNKQLQSQLTTLRLDNNGFDGEVPDAVYDLDALQELTLHDTGVTGDVSAMCEKSSIAVLSTNCAMQVCNEECCKCV